MSCSLLPPWGNAASFTYFIGRKPTSASSEAPVSMAEGSMPWQVESSKGQGAGEHFKYQYHPGGDPTKAPKDAPSALHSVIVPNVNLPKVNSLLCCTSEASTRKGLIENTYSICMTSTINGARMGIRPGATWSGISRCKNLYIQSKGQSFDMAFRINP